MPFPARAIGDAIRSAGRGRYALAGAADIALAESIDPGCSADDPDAAAMKQTEHTT